MVQGGGSRPVEKLIRDTARNYYIGARNAGIGPKGYELPTIRNYWQIGATIMGDFMTDTIFANTLDSATRHNGWFVAMYHAVENAGYSVVHLQKFKNQLDSLEKRKENLWIAPFGEAIRYLRQRQASTITTDTIPIRQGNSYGYNFSVTDTLGNDTLFGHPLTVICNCPALFNCSLVQNGVFIPITPWQNSQPDYSYNYNATILPNGQPYTFWMTPAFGTEKAINKPVISVFPNPAKNTLKVSWNGIILGNIKIALINNLGQEVYSDALNQEAGMVFERNLSLTNLPRGIYQARVQTENCIISRKVVIN